MATWRASVAFDGCCCVVAWREEIRGGTPAKPCEVGECFCEQHARQSGVITRGSHVRRPSWSPTFVGRAYIVSKYYDTHMYNRVCSDTRCVHALYVTSPVAVLTRERLALFPPSVFPFSGRSLFYLLLVISRPFSTKNALPARSHGNLENDTF